MARGGINKAASTQEQLQSTQTRCTVLEERARLAQQDSAEARQQLTDQLQQNRVLELILIKTELALEGLRNDHSTTTAPSRHHPD